MIWYFFRFVRLPNMCQQSIVKSSKSNYPRDDIWNSNILKLKFLELYYSYAKNKKIQLHKAMQVRAIIYTGFAKSLSQMKPITNSFAAYAYWYSNNWGRWCVDLYILRTRCWHKNLQVGYLRSNTQGPERFALLRSTQPTWCYLGARRANQFDLQLTGKRKR